MKAVLIVLCVLIMIGMLALDVYISKNTKSSTKKDNDTSEKEDK